MGGVVAAATLGLLLGGGCSVIVPSTVDHVKCSRPGAIGPPDCAQGQVCNAGECVACEQVQSCAAVGQPCTKDGKCPSGLFCLDPQTVLGQGGTPFCTRGCCTSSECGSGEAVCWPTSRGSGVCRLASDAGRGKPGSSQNGSKCAANTDCRSGACSNGVCIDTCCKNSDCPSSAAPDCALGPVQNEVYSAFYCSAAGPVDYKQPCGTNNDCKSRACVGISNIAGICSQPCCKSSECGDKLACQYYVENGIATRLCLLPQGGTGGAVTGAACSGDSDCRSGKCLDFNGKRLCSDACCRDTDCGNTQLGCRPISVNGTYVLRCVPL